MSFLTSGISTSLAAAGAAGGGGGSTLFLVLLSLCAVAIVWGVAQAISVTGSGNQRLHQRLGLREARAAIAPDAALLRPDAQDWFDGSAAMERFARRLDLVYSGRTLSSFFLLSGVLAVGVGGVMIWLLGPFPFGLPLGLFAGAMPFLLYRRAYAKRQRVLTEQLIDAMDFLARVLRAGHSLASGLQTVSQEIAEPIASEFARAYEQHNLGMSLEEALVEMSERIDLEDFNFFVTSVSIQRQTGGDLAEILDNINTMIRGRVQLAQHVQALTAEGRMTGYLLTALPVAVWLLMYFVNPDYAGMLINTGVGRFMLFGALALQVFGLLVIRKIVNFKV